MEADARADAPVNSESTALTVTAAAEILSSDFQDENGPVERRSPIVEETKADPPELSDDTKVKLKDGAELSIRELKRGYISRKTFTAKTQALAEERARFEDLRVQTQNHATQIAESRLALEIVATALLPQPPDQSLIDADPQLWKALQTEYEFKIGLIQQAQQAAQAEFNAAQAVREAGQRDFVQRQMTARRQQQEKLLEVMPELANESEARRFQEDAIDTMGEYGFSTEELGAALNDWRIFRMVRDLNRYLKAVKAVPKVREKVAAAPVLSGNKRMDRAERSYRASRTELEHFRNSGRLDDAAAILAKRMKD
jgi:hypothetical protein